MGPAGVDEDFARLQQRLVPMWPGMTVRSVGAMRRIVYVVSSVSIDVPSIAPVLPAYEERYLFMVRALARSPGTHVVYVTSTPILPRLVDYYLGMTPADDDPGMRSRVTVVAVGDGSSRPLSEKILARPRLVSRLRAMAEGFDNRLMLPFMVTALEAELAVRLDVPLYGPAPHLVQLGTKTGSREVFAAAGVPHARGVCGVRTRDDVVAAIVSLVRERPAARFVVKTDEGVGGLGNALVTLGRDVRPGAGGDDMTARVGSAVDTMDPGDDGQTSADFLAALAGLGGVVEEWVEGEEVVSPSVQLRTSPLGDVEVLSTHDQLLGGSAGLTFLGCRFPADEQFVPMLTEHGRAIAVELGRRGVIGRFAIDFVMARRDGVWHPYAVEINLRNGGTTHPALTLLGLTDGTYDEESGDFVTATGPKYYVASDHVEAPGYRRLTPDDVIDIVESSGMQWDAGTQTGVALHMVSAVAVAGRLGATAIGRSPEHAQDLFDGLVRALDDAVR